jgi:uroporphyrinogen decarboxylase
MSPAEQAKVIRQTAEGLGITDEVSDLPALVVALSSMQNAGGASAGSMLVALGALEPALSRLVHRDNITFWGGSACFQQGTYLLDPSTPELGASADGVLKTRDDLDKMVFRDIEPIIEQAKAFLAQKGDLAACALVFLGIDPAWHSMGFETFSVACLLDPELVDLVLGPVSDWYAAVTKELCKLDFDFIWAADDIAFHTAPFFSPQVYRDVLLPHTRKVASEITLPWIYHSDGNLLPIWDDLTSQGMNAIHPLEAGAMDIKSLKADYGQQMSFVGGVDLRILEAGTVDETREETKRMINILGPGYGYLLGASNSITPHVKPENFRAMVETLLEYGCYPLD